MTIYRQVISFVLVLGFVFGGSSSYSSEVESNELIQVRVMLSSSNHVKNKFYVKFRNNENPDTILSNGLKDHVILKKRVFNLSGFAEDLEPMARKIGMDRWYVLEVVGNLDEAVVFNKLRNDPNVEIIEPAYNSELYGVIPNDFYFKNQWALHNTGQFGGIPGADIGAVKAWDTIKESSYLIGVIDSGIDYLHPDIRKSIFDGVNL